MYVVDVGLPLLAGIVARTRCIAAVTFGWVSMSLGAGEICSEATTAFDGAGCRPLSYMSPAGMAALGAGSDRPSS